MNGVSEVEQISTEMRILLVTLSNIGDLVMTTPILEALHASYPEHLIDVVADPRSGALLSSCPYLGEIIWRKKRAPWRDKLAFLSAIRARRYAFAVDLRGPWLAWVSRSEKKFSKEKLTSGMHAVEHHYTALANIKVTKKIPPAKLWVPAEARDKVTELLKEQANHRLLALAPGANWPGKIWPATHYAALVTFLQDLFEAVVLLGNDADTERCAQIAEQLPVPGFNLCGRTTLLESAAALSTAAAFVGNDSGLGHMAAALNVPSLTVFGQGDPVRYRPWGEKAEIICAPDQDLSKLAPELVAAKLREHLGAK
ncbi:MAG: glycosyltransferase family 9 protein [Gammaproteobacteria bacterium]